jgi:hypothetical protein
MGKIAGFKVFQSEADGEFSCRHASEVYVDLHSMRSYLDGRYLDLQADCARFRNPLDIGMCRHSAAFVAALLGSSWRFAGVDSDALRRPIIPVGGFRGRGHFWATNDRVIVDLAGVQFGLPPVCVLPCADARYVENYCPRDLQNFHESVWFEVSRWLADWQSRRLFVGSGCHSVRDVSFVDAGGWI